MKQSIADDKAYQLNEAQLVKNVNSAGFQIRDNIPKDGNCLFHAIADQMERLGDTKHSHTSLRSLAVETLSQGFNGVSHSGWVPLRREVPC